MLSSALSRHADVAHDLGDELINQYDDIATVFDAAMGDDFAAIAHPIFVDIIQSHAGRSLYNQRHIDIGCGTGTLLCRTAKEFCMRGCGLDLSAEQLRIARAKAAVRQLNVEFHRVNAKSCSLALDSGLITMTMDALNHLNELGSWKHLVNRIFDALRPGGLFVFDMNTPKRLLVDWMVPEVISKETLTYVQAPLFARTEDGGLVRSRILMQVFSGSAGYYQRHRAVVEQISIEVPHVLELLSGAGFQSVGVEPLQPADAGRHIFMKNREVIWAQKR